MSRSRCWRSRWGVSGCWGSRWGLSSCWSSRRRRPALRAVSATGVKLDRAVTSAPDDHFAAGPYCRVIAPSVGRVGGVGGCPTIRRGVISAAGVKKVVSVASAPGYHFEEGPDGGVTESALRRVGGAGSRPTVGAGIVPATGVGSVTTEGVVAVPAPDNHLAGCVGPHRSVINSPSRRVSRGRCCPAIGRGIISTAGVK